MSNEKPHSLAEEPASKLAQQLKQLATELGFDLQGVAPAVTSSGYSDLIEWIESGYAAGMDYFQKRADAYRHPGSILAGAKSIVVLSYPYPATEPQRIPLGKGSVARYAWPGTDYHDVIHPKLKQLCRLVKDNHPQANARGVVDTAPLMEREIAQLAGLGWRGKNTLLLNKSRGSYFFLTCVLIDIELPVDRPHDETGHCGTCRACLDACPTDAFPSAGVLDANRCISYLTIEHREAIPRELRSNIGYWFFGCDVCQEVCPWNGKAIRNSRKLGDVPSDVSPPLRTLDLLELFQLSEEQFREQFRKTPLWRTRRRGVLRNAAIVLGNQQDTSAIVALSLGINDDDSMVRGASAWALGEIGGPDAAVILRDRLSIETDPEVIEEIAAANQP